MKQLIAAMALSVSVSTSVYGQKTQTVGEKGVFSIEISGVLEPTTTLSEDAPVQFQNEDLEYYLYMIPESKSELLKIYEENEIDLSEGLLMTYASYFANSILTSTLNIAHNQYFLDTIQGVPALIYELAGTIEESPIAFVFGFLEGKENVYILTQFCDAKNRERYLRMMYDVIASFKEE